MLQDTAEVTTGLVSMMVVGFVMTDSPVLTKVETVTTSEVLTAGT